MFLKKKNSEKKIKEKIIKKQKEFRGKKEEEFFLNLKKALRLKKQAVISIKFKIKSLFTDKSTFVFFIKSKKYRVSLGQNKYTYIKIKNKKNSKSQKSIKDLCQKNLTKLVYLEN